MCIRITGIVERKMLSMQVLLPTHLVEKINPNQRSYLHTLSQNRHPTSAFPPRVRHILLHPLPRCNSGWISTLNWNPAVLPPVGRYSTRVGFEAISLFSLIPHHGLAPVPPRAADPIS